MVYEAAKRCFDIAVGMVLLLLVWPLLLLLALCVKLDSPGPVLYRGVRTGRHGRAFRIFKFRTMVVDAERLGTTSVLHDPRVTRSGRWMRACKADELPQIFNVLKGDMSIVGPRPEVEEHTSEYSEEERQILSVRPGITDFASIRFVDLARELGTVDPHREYVSRVRHEKNQLRLQYVRTRSFAVDMKILAATAWIVVKKMLVAHRSP